MLNIQKTLDSLQPYVIGIRYVEGTPVVDVVFKEGWSVPADKDVKMAKGDESMNYFMLYSDSPTIGLDDLLTYVDKIIKLNLEREKKHELLKVKVNELKEIFKKTPLTKLNRLKFIFPDEDLTPNLSDFDVDGFMEDELIQETIYDEEIIEPTATSQNPSVYLDENRNPIELSDEDREILEEEARAKRNIKAVREKRKPTVPNKTTHKIELPPKPEPNKFSEYSEGCECGPNEACEKCIDEKGF